MKRPSGTEKFTISTPTDILQIVDAVAGEKDFNRSCFFKRGAKAYVLHQLSDEQWLWDAIYNHYFNKS